MKCANCHEPHARWDWGGKTFCRNRCAFLYFERVTAMDALFIERMTILKDPMTRIYANGGRFARRTFNAIAAHCPEVIY